MIADARFSSDLFPLSAAHWRYLDLITYSGRSTSNISAAGPLLPNQYEGITWQSRCARKSWCAIEAGRPTSISIRVTWWDSMLVLTHNLRRSLPLGRWYSIFYDLQQSTNRTSNTYGPRKPERSVKHVAGGCCWPVAAIRGRFGGPKFRSLSTGVSAQNFVRCTNDGSGNEFRFWSSTLGWNSVRWADGGWFYTCSNNTWPVSLTVHKQALSKRIYEPMSHSRDTWCTQKPCLHLSLNHIACCRWHSFMYHY